MNPTITAALVAAVASLFVSIFGLVTSGKARRLALIAEETSKRSEQLRLKGTAAGETLLSAMAEVMIQAETVLFFLSRRTEKFLTTEETTKYFAPIGKAASEIRRIAYCTAIYTTPSIRDNLRELLESLEKGEIPFSKWESFVAALRVQHSDIAALFRDTYLKLSA